MKIELSISSSTTTYLPGIAEGVSVEWERKGTPGKLTFSMLKDKNIKVEEGNLVKLKINDTGFFQGYVFTQKQTKDDLIQVTAYDSLRYLKNKDTYFLENETASDLLKRIIADFQLKAGSISDTGYKIAKYTLRNKTLFDMIQETLDLTVANNNKLFILYDNFGVLDLKNINDLKLGLVIGDNTAEDYDYSTSIDNNTYNQIKLAYSNDKTGKDEIYKALDSSNQKKWGLLQHYDSIDEKTNGKAKADTLLKFYNVLGKSLSVRNALGDISVKAGFTVSVVLKDLDINTFMLVERVKHTFNDNEHLMDLSLKGVGAYE